MKIYTTYADEEHWVCQWKHDCILFALINSGAFGPIYFSWLEWNDNMEEKTLEENILFELKVITLWSFITGHYPYRHREIFYTIYSAFMRLTKNREKMDESVYRKKILFYEKKLGELFDLFSNLDGESLNDGSLDERKRVKLKTEDFTSLEDLPYKSLICIENKRWGVYLKADGDNAIVLDSKICDGHSRIPVSALKGQSKSALPSMTTTAWFGRQNPPLKNWIRNITDTHPFRRQNMNRELKFLLLELLKREDEITDSDFLYDAEYGALIKMLDEILANDF